MNPQALSAKLVRPLVLFLLVLGMSFFTAACGKKGSPTLRDYQKPVPPVLAQTIHREDKIILQWGYPADEESAVTNFIILKSSGAEFRTLADVEKNIRYYEDSSGCDNEKSCGYKIIARNLKGVYSNDSNVIEISPLSPPPPPSHPAFEVRNSTLVLKWEPAGKDILYNVYKSFERGKYGLTPVNSSPLSENSFTDAFIINKPVYYTIRSLHGSKIRDEGAASTELVVDPAELVPAPLKNCGYQTFPEKVYIFCNEPEESWVSGFRIYRKTAGQDYVLIGETLIPVFVDNEPALTKRDYRVHAVGPSKEGSGIEIRDILYKPAE